jgi:hypothetical protein
VIHTVSVAEARRTRRPRADPESWAGRWCTSWRLIGWSDVAGDIHIEPVPCTLDADHDGDHHARRDGAGVHWSPEPGSVLISDRRNVWPDRWRLHP